MTRTEDDRETPAEVRRRGRVSDALGIDINLVRDLPAFDPRTESPPTLAARPPRRGPYLKAAVVDAELAPLEADAKAGIPDTVLARRAGFGLAQVRKWRRRRRVSGRRGRPRDHLGTTYLIAHYLGRAVPAVPHITISPVGGDWSPPEYTLRQPLEYALFAEVVSALVGQFSTHQIARAIGIAERDVFNAVVLYEARAR